MTEAEKWGMSGLIAQINPDSPDYNPLAVGMDLTTLGLNLDSNE